MYPTCDVDPVASRRLCAAPDAAAPLIAAPTPASPRARPTSPRTNRPRVILLDPPGTFDNFPPCMESELDF